MAGERLQSRIKAMKVTATRAVTGRYKANCPGFDAGLIGLVKSDVPTEHSDWEIRGLQFIHGSQRCGLWRAHDKGLRTCGPRNLRSSYLRMLTRGGVFVPADIGVVVQGRSGATGGCFVDTLVQPE